MDISFDGKNKNKLTDSHVWKQLTALMIILKITLTHVPVCTKTKKLCKGTKASEKIMASA